MTQRASPLRRWQSVGRAPVSGAGRAIRHTAYAAKAHAVLLVLLGVLFASQAFAAVRLEGAWPDADKPISLDAERLPRSEAVRRVADAMGWSIVLHAPTSDPVDLHVKEQPASKVLSMLLSDHDYVARRDGTLIAIERAKTEPTPSSSTEPAISAPIPPPSPAVSTLPAPPAPPAPPAKGEHPDRVITGGSVRVEKGEIVHDVVVFGGSADVLGTATGDVTVIGGSAKIHAGAHVMGDATAVGGSLDVEDGAAVDGDVGVVGGILRRGEDARIGGEERTDVHLTAKGEEASGKGGFGSWIAGVLADIGSAMTGAALLFVFGAILLALATQRMDTLQTEIASRPMRSFALGVVGLLVFGLLVLAFTLTIIGIPIAFIGSLIAVVAGYAGMCAVLTVVGGALLRHKTRNPYIHLALGCFLFMVAKALPFVGNVVLLAVMLLGIGTLVATRGAGYFPKRKKVAAAR